MSGLGRQVAYSTLTAAEVTARWALTRMPQLRTQVSRWVRRAPAERPALTLGDLERAIGRLAHLEGRHVLVHSAWDALAHLGAKPTEVLAMLQRLVGPRGTLLAPTHPLPIKKNGQLVYDVARTPAATGLLSEALRRAPGAVRSPFPLSSVAALGADAALYGEDFREASGGTPYGRGSPYWLLGEHDGLDLFLGIDFIRANTLEHCAFDLLERENPLPDYYETLDVTVVRGGVSETWTVKQQRRELERYLATTTFKRLMLDEGLVRDESLPGLPVALLDARPFLAWHLELARRTGLPYWGKAWQLIGRRWT
ncbi:MAG: AAC(3) family N-acetyltransferase [Myxococcaceae bacterium]|nr:AAC(3) family N-acetyltransferase [Myxococcaceae bacterium]